MARRAEERKQEILLVEDNPGDASLIRIALEENGFTGDLRVVTDGTEAIDYLHTHRSGPASCPSLVILDLNLPLMPGHEVLKHMRANTSTRAIPVIIMSSSLAHDDIQRAYRLGANCYLPKPRQLPDIFRTVEFICMFWLEMVALPACD